MADKRPAMIIKNGQGGDDVRAKVATDTAGDNRLFVSTELTTVAAGAQASLPPETEWIDMGAATGGIARGTPLDVPDGRTVVFTYTGSGLVYGWLLSLQSMATGWRFYMKTDGNENFGATGLLTDDFKGGALYNYNTSVPNFHMGLATDNDVIRFQGTLSNPLKFETSIEISVERVSNPSKNFQAGLISIYKAT